VSQLVVILLFFVGVMVLGLAIFFYWRSQYGVWAQERKRRSLEGRGVETQTIKYD